jgi:hypothetical protein
VIDTVALLLADRSPSLRLRALVEVDGADPDDPEVASLADEVRTSAEVESVATSARVGAGPIAASFALCRLAYLGVGRGHPVVDALADELFAAQRKDGSWPAGSAAPTGRRPPARPPEEGYEWRPLQVALPLRGLAAAGFAAEPRAERAYEWLLSHRLDDGTWPFGKYPGQASGNVVGYRRLPRSEGCRATTTGALACLVHHPERRTSEDARIALDVLLGRETREESTLGFEVARLVGVEAPRGFATFYARFDLAFLLDLASRTGIANDDARVADLVQFLLTKRGPNGLWEHPGHPHLTRWLTLDLLASLRRLETGEWTGSDLHVPFRAYPKRRRRY